MYKTGMPIGIFTEKNQPPVRYPTIKPPATVPDRANQTGKATKLMARISSDLAMSAPR